MFATDSQIHMKKILLVLFIIATSNLNAQPKKILFVGNSYIYTNNLPLVLYNLALSNGDTIIYDSSTPGGYTFLQHTTNATTLSKINAQAWDYVILQEQSQKPAFPPSQVQTETYPYAAQLNDLILANDSCTQTVFFMTWGRKYGDASNCAFYPPLCTFEGMQWRLRGSYLEMGDDNEALVSPVGEAFKYSRMADSTINLYTPDNSHPSLMGTYLAACTFYATIYETSPIGLSYNAGLTANQAAFLQQIAHQTVFDSLSLWNINEFEPQASFTFNQAVGTPYQYQFTNTSNNSNNYLWYFGNGDSSTTSNPLYTFSGAGVYTVTLVVSNGCISDTINQEITISQFNNLNENELEYFSVSHQNQTLQINIKQNISAQYNVNIYNASGNRIYQHLNLNSPIEFINTSQWRNGIYIVECKSNNQQFTKKISIH
jgi:PKD repeat protein